MNEYAKASEHKELLGKRAQINEDPGYCAYLHGKVGVIMEVYENLFLKFDTPAKTSETDHGMNGCYLTETAFRLEAPALNSYEQKRQEKAKRYQELAEKAQERSDAARKCSDAISSIIPFGQPILIGHHSEGRHRRDIERIHSAMDKSVEESKKAEYYEAKAKATLDNIAISSDNPDAIALLKIKLAQLEARHLELKAIPKDKREWYLLPYSSAEIKRVKERIATLEAKNAMPEIDKRINGVRLVLDKEANRVKVFFPGIPAQEIRDKLKQNGFRWCPTAGAWQRQISNGAINTAEEILTEITPSSPTTEKQEVII
jgi:hypothetical protein